MARDRRWQLAGLAVAGFVVLSSAQLVRGLEPAPNMLVDGSVVDASELNANFAHVVAGVTAVEDRFVPSAAPQLSASSELAEVTATTFAPVAGLSATITTGGNPVEVRLVPDGSSEPGWLEVRGGANPSAEFRIERDGVLVCLTRVGVQVPSGAASSAIPPGGVTCLDREAVAGTHVYTFSAAVHTDGDLLRVYRIRLGVEERGYLTP